MRDFPSPGSRPGVGAASGGYDDFKAMAQHADPSVRASVAADPLCPPEFLFFLAADPAVQVRSAVAGNAGAPAQADAALAGDAEYSVRVILARKFVGEGLDDTERSRLWRMSGLAFEMLAADAFLRVRKLLSDAVHALGGVPRPVVLTLARDEVEEVAAPVLRHSPELTDEDLVDIVETSPAAWAAHAVAQRETVPASVSAAIVARADPGALGALAANPGADLLGTGLAPAVPRPVRAPEAEDVRDKAVPLKPAGAAARPRRARRSDAADLADAAARALASFRKGTLLPDTLADALDRGDQGFVAAGLALRAGVPLAAVQRILKSNSARRIAALSWKAGCTMRFAVDLQVRVAKLTPQSILYARNGVEYPLGEAEMRRQIALFLD